MHKCYIAQILFSQNSKFMFCNSDFFLSILNVHFRNRFFFFLHLKKYLTIYVANGTFVIVAQIRLLLFFQHFSLKFVSGF